MTQGIRNKLHAKFYDIDRTEMVLHQKSQAFSGKYGHTALALIRKWFPDVAIMEIWYNDVILFTINLIEITYWVDNRQVRPDQKVMYKGTIKKYDEKIAQLMAENERLKEELNGTKAHKSGNWGS
jgi:hypothetical protein